MKTHPRGNVLVVPVEGGHEESGIDCWCVPTWFVPCDECEDGVGCWKCDAGKIWLTRDEALAEERVIIIVHNRSSSSGSAPGGQ